MGSDNRVSSNRFILIGVVPIASVLEDTHENAPCQTRTPAAKFTSHYALYGHAYFSIAAETVEEAWSIDTIQLHKYIAAQKALKNLADSIAQEDNSGCKRALTNIYYKLNTAIFHTKSLGVQYDISPWIKSEDYKKDLATLQWHSKYNTFYNCIRTILSFFNPWRESSYYTPNTNTRGNKYLFWADGHKQKAEVAITMAEKYLTSNNI